MINIPGCQSIHIMSKSAILPANNPPWNTAIAAPGNAYIDPSSDLIIKCLKKLLNCGAINID